MPTRATYSLASMAGFPGVGLVGNAGRGIALYPLKSERAEVEIEELGLGRPPRLIATVSAKAQPFSINLYVLIHLVG